MIGRGTRLLFFGYYEAVVEGLHNNVQVERAVNEVLGCSTLQVRFQQKVSRLFRALVEVVDMTDHHLPLLAGRNDDGLLKADASKVRAGGGRCDDDPRTPRRCERAARTPAPGKRIAR